MFPVLLANPVQHLLGGFHHLDVDRDGVFVRVASGPGDGHPISGLEMTNRARGFRPFQSYRQATQPVLL